MNRTAAVRATLIATLGAGLCGCAGVRSYPLPVAAAEARALFAPLVQCGAAEGFQADEHPDAIHVRYDESSWMQFMIQGSAFNLVLIVDPSLPPAELTAKDTAVKTKADSLFACARRVAGGAPPPPAPPAPPKEPPPPGSNKVVKEAGPIWSNDDAPSKCPKTCAPLAWKGAWWTTVEGKMSVCECIDEGVASPAPSAAPGVAP